MASKNLEIPVLDLLHPLLVDKAGNIVSGDPRPGTFAARESLPYHYDNTPAPSFKKIIDSNPVAKTIWRSYDNWVKRRLDKTIFAISQTDIGCDLLSWAYRDNVSLSMHPSLFLTGYKGNYAQSSKHIDVLLGFEKRAVELVLAHELEHARHMHGAPKSKVADSLASRIYKERVTEIAARIVPIAHAYQAEYGRSDEPGATFHFKDYRRPVRKIDPIIASQAHKFRHLAKTGQWAEFTGKLFEADKTNFSEHRSYDLKIIKLARKAIHRMMGYQSVLADKNYKVMSEPADISGVRQELRVMGQDYLDLKMLGDPDLTELSPGFRTARQYKKFMKEAAKLNDRGYEADLEIPRPGTARASWIIARDTARAVPAVSRVFIKATAAFTLAPILFFAGYQTLKSKSVVAADQLAKATSNDVQIVDLEKQILLDVVIIENSTAKKQPIERPLQRLGYDGEKLRAAATPMDIDAIAFTNINLKNAESAQDFPANAKEAVDGEVKKNNEAIRKLSMESRL